MTPRLRMLRVASAAVILLVAMTAVNGLGSETEVPQRSDEVWKSMGCAPGELEYIEVLSGRASGVPLPDHAVPSDELTPHAALDEFLAQFNGITSEEFKTAAQSSATAQLVLETDEGLQASAYLDREAFDWHVVDFVACTGLQADKEGGGG